MNSGVSSVTICLSISRAILPTGLTARYVAVKHSVSCHQPAPGLKAVVFTVRTTLITAEFGIIITPGSNHETEVSMAGVAIG